MKKKYFIPFFIFSAIFCSRAATNVSLTIDSKATIQHNKNLYGGFIEFYPDVVNGQFGFCAQEIMDRGFDDISDVSGVAKKWLPYKKSESNASIWECINGGVNKNGVYYQKITKNGPSGSSGVYQSLYLDENKTHNLYVYLKSNKALKNLRIEFWDTTFSTKFYSIDSILTDTSWNKYSFVLPKMPGAYHPNILICFDGQGELGIDEISLMASDAMFNVRREYVDILKKYPLGSLRYPGGCFSDLPANQWKYGLEDLDQRKSPNYDWFPYDQRFEFGLNEYLALCKYCGISPFITLNYGSATVQDAADQVEYCNGAVSTKYGAIRAKLLSAEPMNVKIWELGNEMYGDWEIGHGTGTEYGKRLFQIDSAMRCADPNIYTIADGNLWDDTWNKDMINSMGANVNAVSWHSWSYSDSLSDINIRYKSMVGDAEFLKYFLKVKDDFFKNNNFNKFRNQALTEVWPRHVVYSSFSNDKAFTMEDAIWQTSNMRYAAERSDMFGVVSRTTFYGLMKGEISRQGRRIFVSGPSIYAIGLMNVHSGDFIIPSSVNSPYYVYNYLWEDCNVPYVETLVTASQDSLFILAINKSSDEYYSLQIPTNNSITVGSNEYKISQQDNAKLYLMTSDNFLDSNYADAPFAIVPQESSIALSDNLLLKPFSVNILAIKLRDTNGFEDHTDLGEIQASPNPFNEKFSILNIPDGTNKIEVYNSIGEIVYSRDKDFSNNVEINSANFTNGVYFIKLMSNVKTRILKAVKD